MKDFPYVILMRAVWQHLGMYKKAYVIAHVALTLSLLLFLLQPYLMGMFFDTLQQGIQKPENFRKVIILMVSYALINPISWILWGPARIVARRCAYLVRRDFVNSYYRKLRSLPYAWHQNFHTGQLYDRVRKAEDALHGFTSGHYRYIRAFVDIVGPITVLIVLFKWYGLACLALALVATKVVIYFDGKIVSLYKIRNKLTHIYAGAFSDYLGNIRTIIALRLGQETQSELLAKFDARKDGEWEEIRLNEWRWFTVDTMGEFIICMIIVSSLFLLEDRNTVKIGSMVMLFQYLFRFSNVFSTIGDIYQTWTNYVADYTSIQMIEDDYQAYKAKGMISGNDDRNQMAWQQIVIANLSFAYEDDNHRPAVINNLAMSFRSGQKIAFVGESGSGKSTLMAILRGLYQPSAVSLTIDGQNYNTLMPLADVTTLIPQDPEIFENTIRYNITFGVTHTEDEIMEACRIAGFDTVLQELPQGLESDIREKGVNLSGGQKQRLALARGIFAIQQSSLILMDEPTSSVDTLTELRIFDTLFDVFKDKAIIVSVHRLHLLSRFDHIYYMSGGKVVEQGTLSDLVAMDGYFTKLWQEYCDSSDFKTMPTTP
jgi:ATP-binding cassette subfamily B protein